ncbi:MAG TPA: hypothetical protein VHN99_08380 [Deinococcales bacterium]|nr:hypothetical protein [Deinococcales bacterium]
MAKIALGSLDGTVKLAATDQLRPGIVYLEFDTSNILWKPVLGLVANASGWWDRNIVTPFNHKGYVTGGLLLQLPKTNFVDPVTGKDKVGGTYQRRKWIKGSTLVVRAYAVKAAK